MRIVFMGTPEFAVASFKALMDAGFEIAGVVTAPDKPAGRGLKPGESAVKLFAASRGLTILQPLKLKDPEFIAALAALRADLQVIVAFRMLPEAVWSMPPKGTLNLHASLLPQYRGAAPINWAIMNGETETGITTFLLKHEIDTGDIIFSEKIPVAPDETAGMLHDKLMTAGATLLVKTVRALEQGDVRETAQDTLTQQAPDALKHAPKLFSKDRLIDWNRPVRTVYDHIRGLSPYPAAYIIFKEKTLKIYAGETEVKEPAIYPGGFLTDNRTFLKFACKDGFICLTDLQLEGKKRMTIGEFLRGIRL